MDERRTLNPEVAGSNPALPTIGLLGLLAEESCFILGLEIYGTIWYYYVIMKHEITKQTKTNATLTITADEKYMAVYHQAVLKRLKKDLKVDGFRPGHAPDKIAERQLGEQRVQSEVLEEIVMHAYAAAIRDAKLTTVSAPRIEVKKFVPYTELEFTAEVAIMPDIKFDLTKLSVKYDAPKVEDKDVAAAIEELRKQLAERTEVTRAVKDGDEVVLDYEGVREGKPVEGAGAQNQTLVIGSKQFIPGFEEEVIGLKKDDTKKFTITFPKDYHAKDLAGKDVEFTITINKISEVVLPKLDDGFATHIGPFKTFKELEKNVRESLEARAVQDYQKEYEDKVVAELMDKAKFEVSDELVHDVAHNLEHETADQLKNSGLTIEKYMQMQKKSKEDFEKELHVEAERRVKLGILMRWLIEKEGINTNEQEIDTELEHMREHYKDPKMQSELNDPKFRDDLRTHILTTKAIKKLVDYAK